MECNREQQITNHAIGDGCVARRPPTDADNHAEGSLAESFRYLAPRGVSNISFHSVLTYASTVLRVHDCDRVALLTYAIHLQGQHGQRKRDMYMYVCVCVCGCNILTGILNTS